MVGTIYYITDKLNSDLWELRENGGHVFEDFILKVTEDWCNTYYPGSVRIYQTPGSNDNGKDIIIESNCSLLGLFNQQLKKEKEYPLKIYIECKSSDSYKISYNDLSGNLKLSAKNNISYYMLVTNTTITPYTLYQLQDEAKRYGFQFLLIDQYFLYRFLNEQSTMLGKYIPPEKIPDIHAEYQLFSEQHENKTRFCIYLLIRNYTNTIQKIDLQIKTDHNWAIEQENLPQILEAGESSCCLLIADKIYYDGLDELFLMLQSSVFEKTLSIKGINLSHNFIPPLHGKEHQNIINNMVTFIKKSSNFNIFYIFGQAGIGKSRITDEIAKILNGTTIKCNFITYSSKGNIYKKIKDFLKKEKLLLKEPFDKTLVALLKECKSNFKKYVLFIDDVHNGDSIFFEEIKVLLSIHLELPITIMLLGRDDFSEGSTSYYSFINQCYSKEISIKGYQLSPLNDIESEQLIQSIISDAPKSVLKRIKRLSNNIPLYIVQFIEYLLDIELVQIINRSTVGIINAESFSSHTYIPSKIEDIYRKRIENLNILPDGVQMVDFLLMVSIIGIEFPKKVFLNYFDNDENILGLLINRYFLSYSKDGNLRFVHESLYLYLLNYLNKHYKKKKEIAIRILEYEYLFFEHMVEFDQGEVCYWAGKIQRSEIYFKKIITDIVKIENYSSITVDSSYRKYLDTVYQIMVSLKYDSKYLKNALFCRIYLSLHYFTPHMAVKECDKIEKIVSKSSKIENKEMFLIAVLEQKAHSYINMGQLRSGEHLLMELLATMLHSPHLIDDKTKFDLYDKLTNINLKYNNLNIAKNYNQLAFRTAEKLQDTKLKALSEISRGKMYLYRDLDKAEEALISAEKYLSQDNENRISCHNHLSQIVISMRKNFDQHIYSTFLAKDAQLLLKQSQDGNYANSIIRGYLLLSTITVLNSPDLALNYANLGIDASVRWGQANYMWHFYNLKAIIAMLQGKKIDYISKLFETVYRLLQRQNLLFWGALDFSYENILAMTNIMKFQYQYGFESTFYMKIASISYDKSNYICDYNCDNNKCNFNCAQATKSYKKEYKKIGSGKLLLVNKDFSYSAYEPQTGYYLLFS